MKELKSRHDATTKGLHNCQGINKTHPWYNIKLILVLTMTMIYDIIDIVACMYQLGDPWEPKGIPWEGTHGRGTLGSPRDPMGGVLDHPGRGTLGSQRDPMGGDPWDPHWELFGGPRTSLEAFCDEVSFQEC